MWHGILVINKESGLSSHQVVAKLRRILGQADIGHTGTLDPEATGVLVVGLGCATRAFSLLEEATKLYQAEIILGQATDTQDASGRVLREQPDLIISLAELQAAIRELSTLDRQTPPMYSAVKSQGRKLYDLARQGIEIERPSRPIRVYDWQILNPQISYGFKEPVVSKITCSKGTYIRTLSDDLGRQLGCGAHMGKLLRLKSGEFSLDSALLLPEVEAYLKQGKLAQFILSISQVLGHLPSIRLEVDDLAKAEHGGRISYAKYQLDQPVGSIAQILNQDLLAIAVAELRDAGEYLYWQPVKVFRYN